METLAPPTTEASNVIKAMHVICLGQYPALVFRNGTEQPTETNSLSILLTEKESERLSRMQQPITEALRKKRRPDGFSEGLWILANATHDSLIKGISLLTPAKGNREINSSTHDVKEIFQSANRRNLPGAYPLFLSDIQELLGDLIYTTPLAQRYWARVFNLHPSDEARDQAACVLAASCVRLTLFFAKKSATKSNVPIEYFISEGLNALWDAICRYNVERPEALSDYVAQSLINRMTQVEWRVLGEGLSWKAFRGMQRVRRKVLSPLNLSKEQIAQIAEVDLEAAAAIKIYLLGQPSLQAPVFPKAHSTLTRQERLSDHTQPEEDALYNEQRAQILQLLNVTNSRGERLLSERASQILMLRFGLVDGKCWTQSEIGKLLNLTRSRVQQIEKASLEKIRRTRIPEANRIKSRLEDYLINP